MRRLLEAYRATPGTGGAVRGPDRLLAAQLYERGVGLEAVENALILAAPPLGVIRSLTYFSPVIEVVLEMKVGSEYFRHLRKRAARLTEAV